MPPIAWKFYLKMLAYGLGIAAILFLGSAIWNWIYDRGAQSVQVLWDAEKSDYAAEVVRVEQEYADKEAAHRNTNRKLNDDLAQERLNHALALAAAERTYDQRLRLSEQRASVYQRQAAGGTAQCADLASHASRLDGTLEEGRFLVRELRETLGLRDQQIRALSTQILNDRTLIEEESP